MSQTDPPRPDFEALLQAEVARILADPAFDRSPVQSKLLSYLCEQTVAGGGGATQFGIAVDALGRGDDYDLVSESYPRVQISRLRQNLAEYYSRVQAGDGLCVYLRRGDYSLRLAPHDKAYPPDTVRPRAPAAIEPEAPLPRARARAMRWPPESGKSSRPLLFTGIGLLLALATAGAWLFLRHAPRADAADLSQPPAVALAVTDDLAGAAVDGDPNIAGSLARLAQAQIAGSFVARVPAPGDPPGTSDFQLKLNVGSGIDNAPEASIALVDAGGNTLFADNVAYQGDRGAFLNRFGASLSGVFQPNGVVAQTIVPKIRKPTQSDFACHLTIEARRVGGLAPVELIDRCLKRFPRSNFAPYWMARKAAMMYQVAIARGEPVGRSGPAWALLREVFERDPHNTYGNMLMAKIEFAAGQCELANRFGEQAMARGGFYPTLFAMHVSERAGCGIPEGELAQVRGTLQALADANPNPDPLMRLHLLLASAAVGLHGVAEGECHAATLQFGTGRITRMADLVCRALADPGYATTHRGELRGELGLYLWSAAARENLLDRLAAGSAGAVDPATSPARFR